MNRQIEHLSQSEKNLITNAPLLVTAYISGIDGHFNHNEIEKAVKIIHIKSYSETRDVRGIYKDLDQMNEEKIAEVIDSLPKDTFERNEEIIKILSGLNDIFPKLDSTFAKDLVKSLRELAYYVANAHDSGISISNDLEKEAAKLDFLTL